MPLWANFLGGTYQARSPVIAADQAVNIYRETRAVPGDQPAKIATFYGTPGRLALLTADGSVCRGLFTQDGRTFGTFGDSFGELDVTLATYTELATVLDDGLPVFYASNGRGGDQLGILGAGELRVLDLVTNVVTTAALPFSNPVMLAFMDGYALINEADSPIVWYSALEDMETWDALDFFARSGTSDNLVGIGVSKDRLRCFGSKTTTDFYDSGDVDTPFLPYPGTTVQVGLLSPYLLGIYQDMFYFVGQTSKGDRRVLRGTDVTPEAISTPPIDRFLAGCTTLADAEMLIYEQEGHPFVALTCPSSTDAALGLPVTYVYDARESLWHARGGWDSVMGVWTRWPAKGSTGSAVEGLVLVGDATSGDVFVLDLDTYTDDGGVLMRERTAPYLGNENQWMFLVSAELGIQAGVGLSSGQGSDPEVLLSISRDGARTWAEAGAARLGALGEYGARAIWRQLGRARADLLVIRVRQSDPVKTVWGPGLWLRTTSGTGQL